MRRSNIIEEGDARDAAERDGAGSGVPLVFGRSCIHSSCRSIDRCRTRDAPPPPPWSKTRVSSAGFKYCINLMNPSYLGGQGANRVHSA